MLDRTGLARKPAALDRGDDIVLAFTLRNRERLVDDEAQRRAREIGFLVAAIDDDLAGAGLEPDAGNGILAAAGRIGAAERVHLLLAQRHGAGAGDFRHAFGGKRSVRSRGIARQGLEIGEIGNGVRFGVGFVGHYTVALFLRFIEATSSATGWVPACGCSEPA
ncbi:MAG: hypothetical protein H6R45_829 [Proteobacteria bacterium]|nr:hypothetical protein [Pseudomonadota bacterium]